MSVNSLSTKGTYRCVNLCFFCVGLLVHSGKTITFIVEIKKSIFDDIKNG